MKKALQSATEKNVRIMIMAIVNEYYGKKVRND